MEEIGVWWVRLTSGQILLVANDVTYVRDDLQVFEVFLSGGRRIETLHLPFGDIDEMYGPFEDFAEAKSFLGHDLVSEAQVASRRVVGA